MRCSEAEHAVPLYVARELEAGLVPAVEGHLRECHACSELARDMEGIDALCRQTLEALPRDAGRPRLSGKRSGALASAVILAAVGLAAYAGWRKSAPASGDLPGTGRVVARVTFGGTRPRPAAVAVTEANACCKAHVGREMSTEDDELGEVLVYVKSGPPRNETPPPADPVVLKKQGCAFVPRVVVLRVDQKLILRNHDPGPDSLRLECRKNKACTFRLSGREAGREFRDEQEGSFPLPEFGMRLESEEHPWIRAVVHVMDPAEFALVGPDGNATLAALPAGDYEVAVWHPRRGEKKTRVTVREGRSTSIVFAFED